MPDPAEQLADWKAKTLAKIHGQPPHRTYTTAEVKQIVYPLLAVVESVLALHRPETRYVARGYEEYSFETRSDALEYGEEVTTFDVCVHCGRVETDDDEDRRYRDSIWPCATVRAIESALGGDTNAK